MLHLAALHGRYNLVTLLKEIISAKDWTTLVETLLQQEVWGQLPDRIRKQMD